MTALSRRRRVQLMSYTHKNRLGENLNVRGTQANFRRVSEFLTQFKDVLYASHDFCVGLCIAF
jgi:hypothetical protein